MRSPYFSSSGRSSRNALPYWPPTSSPKTNDARIGRERVADAVHHRFEERHALRVERRRVLDGERRRLGGASPPSRSSTSTRRAIDRIDRRSRRWSRGARSGHGASMTARASASTSASASLLHAIEIAGVDRRRAPRALRRSAGIGSRARQNS